MSELITIKEFAIKANKTTQNIYKSIKNGKLNGYIEKITGEDNRQITMIKSEALKLFENTTISINNFTESQPKEQSTNSELESMAKEIKELRERNNELVNQLNNITNKVLEMNEQANERAREQNELIKNNQILMKNILDLTNKKNKKPLLLGLFKSKNNYTDVEN